MSPQNYLFHVNSGPIVSDDLWREFYTSEHLPDIVNSGCAVRATFYEEVPTPLSTASSTTSIDRPRHFLALYQSEYPELMKTSDHHKVRVTSSLFAREGRPTDRILENGTFDGRNFRLIQEYDPLGMGETPPPQILTVEMQPPPRNLTDFDRCYREQYLDHLRTLPGYRRSLRYELGPECGFDAKDHGVVEPHFLAVHELDDLAVLNDGGDSVLVGEDMEWSARNIEESEVVVARGWRLVHSLGF